MLRPADSPTLPRLLHPVAWWVWGIGMAAAATRTTNPVLLLLIVLVVCTVTLARQERPKASVLFFFLLLGLTMILFRLFMAIVLGSGPTGSHLAFRLPQIPLPDWFGSIQIGGKVTWERIQQALYDGLQLTAILVCIGAANALATPHRVLRYLPATLYDVGTAAVVALTYAPQLAHDARQVRAARRLRGHSTRSPREVGRLIMPVLDSGLERSLDLAASMESRGYGRAIPQGGAGAQRSARRSLASGMALVGAVGVIIGLYGLLDGTTPTVMGWPVLVTGALLGAAALAVGARSDSRSSYRQGSRRLPEWGVVVLGALPVLVMTTGSRADTAALTAAVGEPWWPVVPLVPVAAVLLVTAAAILTPVPPARIGHAPALPAGRSVP